MPSLPYRAAATPRTPHRSTGWPQGSWTAESCTWVTVMRPGVVEIENPSGPSVGCEIDSQRQPGARDGWRRVEQPALRVAPLGGIHRRAERHVVRRRRRRQQAQRQQDREASHQVTHRRGFSLSLARGEGPKAPGLPPRGRESPRAGCADCVSLWGSTPRSRLHSIGRTREGRFVDLRPTSVRSPGFTSLRANLGGSSRFSVVSSRRP